MTTPSTNYVHNHLTKNEEELQLHSRMQRIFAWIFHKTGWEKCSLAGSRIHVLIIHLMCDKNKLRDILDLRFWAEKALVDLENNVRNDQ